MTRDERDALFDANMNLLRGMGIVPSAAVKGFIMSCERQGPAYIRLMPPVNSHSVGYTLLEGGDGLLHSVGNALGIRVYGDRLVVPHE